MTSTAIKTTDLLLRPEFAPKVLRGEKTQTRRIVTLDSELRRRKGDLSKAWVDPGGTIFGPGPYLKVPCATDIDGSDDGGTVQRLHCHYGYSGDHLRFLTTWAVDHKWDRHKPLDLPRHVKVWTAFDNGNKPRGGLGKLRPGRFMPLWMRARLPVFELTEFRVERVQEISDADCFAEGVVRLNSDLSNTDGHPILVCNEQQPREEMAFSVHQGPPYYTYAGNPREAFRYLWDGINNPRDYCEEDAPTGWSSNPWCWVLSFRKASP